MRKQDNSFLSLPDFRENLIMELLPGVPSGSTIPDTSGNGHDGVITNSTRVAGPGLPVRDFTPAGSKITVANHNDLKLNAGAITVIFWLNITGALANFDYLYSKGGNLRISPLSLGRLYSYTFDNEESQELECISPNDSYFNDEWFMLTWVADTINDFVKFYNNLTLKKTCSITGSPYNQPDDIIIGQGVNADQFLGEIGLVRQYNAALNSDQIKQVFQHTRRYVMGMSPKL